MPEIKVTEHYYYGDSTMLNTHAREGDWVGPKLVMWLTYDGFPLELVFRREENGNWDAANLFHDELFLFCPFCGKRATKKCEKAATFMDQIAEAALNSPSFRLIALFEL